MGKRIVKIGMVLVLIGLSALACKQPFSNPDPPTQMALPPTAIAPQKITPAGIAPQQVTPPPVAPSAGSACKKPVLNVKPSGIISKVTMAKNVKPETYDPIDPTNVFAPEDVFHAVAVVNKAPEDTRIKVLWLASDTAGVLDCDSQLYEYEDTTAGAVGNFEFYLNPKSKWPVGFYRIEIYVNDVLDQATFFSVK